MILCISLRIEFKLLSRIKEPPYLPYIFFFFYNITSRGLEYCTWLFFKDGFVVIIIIIIIIIIRTLFGS